MADTSHNHDKSWVTFAVGAVIALILVLGYAAWRSSQQGIQTLGSTDFLPNLQAARPSSPQIPDTPAPFRR